MTQEYINGDRSASEVRDFVSSKLESGRISAAETAAYFEEMEYMDQGVGSVAPRRGMYLQAIENCCQQHDLKGAGSMIDAAIERGLLPEWLKDIDPFCLNQSNLPLVTEYLEEEKLSADELVKGTASLLNGLGCDSSLVSLRALEWAAQQRKPGFEVPLDLYSRVIETCERASRLQEAAQVKQELVAQKLIPDPGSVPHTVPWQRSNFPETAQYLKGLLNAQVYLSTTAVKQRAFRQDPAGAMNLLGTLAWAGVAPPAQMYHRAILACADANDADGALALHAHMLEHCENIEEKNDATVLHVCATAAKKAYGNPEEASRHADSAMQLETFHPRSNSSHLATTMACHYAAAAWAASKLPDKMKHAAAHADAAVSVLNDIEGSLRPGDLVTSTIAACAKAAAAGSVEHAQKALSIYRSAIIDGVPIDETALTATVSALVDSGNERMRSRATTLIEDDLDPDRGLGLCHPELGKNLFYGDRMPGENDVADFHYASIFTGKNNTNFQALSRQGVAPQMAFAVLDFRREKGGKWKLNPGPEGTLLSFGTGEGRTRAGVVRWIAERGFTQVDVIKPNRDVAQHLLRFRERDPSD